MKDVIADLTWRGLVHQTTSEELAEWLRAAPRTVYAGFDPTAESLHIGSLMPVLLLRRFQQAGHRPIAVVGGSTGMIGDPSGKSAERNLLSTEQLQANLEGIEAQLRCFLDFDHGEQSALLLNNYDWMRDRTYLDFLRDVGKCFPINVMLTKDSVKSRIESDAGLSYTEFSYMLLQAFDFVHLQQNYDCRLQVGGSDQWGNITAGIDLARRMHGVQLYGLTCPLLTKSDGSKMGKTESGAVWLSADRTSPYAFYQYLINVDDDDAGTCLRYLTDLEQAEVEALDVSRREQPHTRESQKRLAAELTSLVHGTRGLQAAQRATDVFFGAEIDALTESELSDVFGDVPSQELSREQLRGDGLLLVDALVAAGLGKSKGEARRTIQQGGAYVNNRRNADTDARLTEADLVGEATLVLRTGKRKYALLRFAG